MREEKERPQRNDAITGRRNKKKHKARGNYEENPNKKPRKERRGGYKWKDRHQGKVIRRENHGTGTQGEAILSPQQKVAQRKKHGERKSCGRRKKGEG